MNQETLIVRPFTNTVCLHHPSSSLSLSQTQIETLIHVIKCMSIAISLHLRQSCLFDSYFITSPKFLLCFLDPYILNNHYKVQLSCHSSLVFLSLILLDLWTVWIFHPKSLKHNILRRSIQNIYIDDSKERNRKP